MIRTVKTLSVLSTLVVLVAYGWQTRRKPSVS